jgi:hypothetical protein
VLSESASDTPENRPPNGSLTQSGWQNLFHHHERFGRGEAGPLSPVQPLRRLRARASDANRRYYRQNLFQDEQDMYSEKIRFPL